MKRIAAATDYVVPLLLVAWVPFLAAGYVIDHNSKARQYRTSVAACERVNTLTRKVNAKFNVYDKAARKTADALEPSKTKVGHDLRDVWAAAAVVNPGEIPLTDCMSAFDRPRWFWQ